MKGARACRTGRCFAILFLLYAGAPARLFSQSRFWSPEERALVTDLFRVTAVAVTGAVVYAATPNGLAVYDRAFRGLRETVGELNGFPGFVVTAMAADPMDDTAWLGGRGRWAQWRPLGRTWDSGVLPGEAELVVLDSRDPSAGAYFRTARGWYFVAKLGGTALSTPDAPPPGRRLGGLTAAELRSRVPAFEVARLRIERDEMLRSWPATSAAAAPGTGEVYIATDGNGVFRLDPLTAQAERLPTGVLGANVGAVALDRGQVCAGSDDRLGTRRRGITCFSEDLQRATYYEQGPGLAAMPGSEMRRLAVSQRAIWAATDRGLMRVDRRSRRAEQLGGADDLPSDDVRAVADAPSGAWVGTTLGLAFVTDTARRLSSDATDITTSVYAIALRLDTLWLGSAAGALARPAVPEVLGAVSRVNVDGRPVDEPVVAIAAGAGGVLAATRGRLFLIAAGTARWLAPPPPPLGNVGAIVADSTGFWVAGRTGFGFLAPERNAWLGVVGPGDVPAPINDLAVGSRYVWVASDGGLLRFEKRALLR